MMTTVGITDDLLIHLHYASDHVEFGPMRKVEAVDELVMVNARIRSAPCPAPRRNRRRLSSGAHRNLTRQTIEMPLGLSLSAECFFQVQSAKIDYGPRLSQPPKRMARHIRRDARDR
ncbi:hypothetical protein A6U92_16440 [Agrobacterium rubi]|nr:hypothetical protein A6U92_16440 [Agrobacterium rubi]